MDFIISVEHQVGTCLLTCLFSMFLFCFRPKSTYCYVPQLNLSVTTKLLKSEVGADVFGVIF